MDETDPVSVIDNQEASVPVSPPNIIRRKRIESNSELAQIEITDATLDRSESNDGNAKNKDGCRSVHSRKVVDIGSVYSVGHEAPVWLLYTRVVFMICTVIYLLLRQWYHCDLRIPRIEYTVRVNTFRRNDLLEKFLAHYSMCSDISEIQVTFTYPPSYRRRPLIYRFQVVWSDQKSSPPDWLHRYKDGKVFFELHRTNSLSNRFKALRDVKTEVVHINTSRYKDTQ